MTICANCDHENFEGALFCSECGAALITQGGISTATITAAEAGVPEAPAFEKPPPPTPTVDAIVSLHVVRTGQILPLVGRNEFTVGRVSEGQSILPDIDLTPYEAYNQGVSRLHSIIRIDGSEITITDLGSSNGTRVNNVKISPHKEHPLNHGDVIALGQFKIQALVRQD
jgi:pSer/pThr/pTyr-binding forkhead associated (FHA) protein